jgi:hypothetical protein
MVCLALRTEWLTVLQIPLPFELPVLGQIMHFCFLTVGYNVIVALSLWLCWINFTIYVVRPEFSICSNNNVFTFRLSQAFWPNKSYLSSWTLIVNPVHSQSVNIAILSAPFCWRYVYVGSKFQMPNFLSIQVRIITTLLYLQHCYSKHISQLASWMECNNWSYIQIN